MSIPTTLNFFIKVFKFPLFFLSTTTSFLSNVNNQTTEQRCLKQDQLVSRFTHVDGWQSKLGATHLFEESKIIVYRIHVNDLLRDNVPDLVTIYHPTMGRVCAGVAHPCEFLDLEDPIYRLGDMVSASMYIRES